jgi:arginase family enzyme
MMHQPPDALDAPRFTGPRTFARLPHGINFVGFDVVEVARQYDGPGQVTALFAANVPFEMLTLAELAGSGD